MRFFFCFVFLISIPNSFLYTRTHTHEQKKNHLRNNYNYYDDTWVYLNACLFVCLFTLIEPNQSFNQSIV